jgi:hypothetical protein
MSTQPGLNIRFLAQGMLKLSPEQLPEGFFEWSVQDQIQWAKDYWESRTREDLLEAVAYLDLEEDSVPDCLEVDDEDYTILAQTSIWDAFYGGSKNLCIPEEEGHEPG